MLQLDQPETIDNAGDSFSRYGSATKAHNGRRIAEVKLDLRPLGASAGAALYRRSMLDEIGLFDESFESYLEDVDLSLRARLHGYACELVPEARVHHASGGSGLIRSRYVRLTTANRAATVLKNFPLGTLIKSSHRLLWGQCYFFLVLRHPLQSLFGYWNLFIRLPQILRERSRIREERVLSASAFQGLLATSLGEPTLRQLLSRRLGGTRSRP